MCLELSLKAPGVRGEEVGLRKTRSKEAWILQQSASCPSCLCFSYSHCSIPLHTLCSPCRAHICFKCNWSTVCPSLSPGCSSHIGFYRRKTASTGPFLISSGQHQPEFSDLFQSQNINNYLRKKFKGNTKVYFSWEGKGWDKFSSFSSFRCKAYLGNILAIYYHIN